MNILKETYNNKKIFVTGHTGFKGAWLVRWLHQIGATVKGYALPAEPSSLFYKMKGEYFCESVHGDIRDAAKLKKELHDFEPDFVFHLAAQSLVRESYRDPLYTYAANTLGTAHLLDALRGLQKKCTVVVITTDKVYENLERRAPYKETDRLGGYDPYSASKACTEIITQSYQRAFFHADHYEEHEVAIATARAGNVIGGGDWAVDRLIPDIVRGLEKRETIVLRCPMAVRPWQHVLEPLYGYLLLGRALERHPFDFAEGWNFGPEISDNLTVEEVVQRSLDVWGSGRYEVQATDDHFHEANLLRLDIEKVKTRLHWRPVFSADVAIEKTIAWYRDYLNERMPAGDLVLRDIEEYEEKERGDGGAVSGER
ncbi:MAG: CDP-glucose 4,6-dehydratase [Bacteroidota bacterium]